MSAAVDRIVVALDAVSEHTAAIGAAARLAQRWKTRLHGIFVVDDDLLRLAHMPFARQVTLGLGGETLTLQHAEGQMRLFAARARQELAASAQRHGLKWSFEVVRRGDATAGTAATGTYDFVVAGAMTRPIGAHFRVQCRAWLAEPSSAVSLLIHDRAAEGPVAVLLQDRKPVAERLLATAARVAAAGDVGLNVIVDPALAATPGFNTWFEAQIGETPTPVEVEPLPASQTVPQRLAGLHARLLALAAGSAEAKPDRLRELLTKVACDVLIVR
jgi:hypothetical protein